LNAPGAAVKSIATTIIDNLMPFFFRATLIVVGLILIAGLLWNAANSSGLISLIGNSAEAAAIAA